MSDKQQILDSHLGSSHLQNRVEMYKVYLEQSRHAEILFFNFSKHFTTIVVLLTSSAGAILAAANMDPSAKRALATFVIALAAFVSFLAYLVIRGMGEYVNHFVDRRDILERFIGDSLGDQELIDKIGEAQTDRNLVRNKLLVLFIAFSSANVVLSFVIWFRYATS